MLTESLESVLDPSRHFNVGHLFYIIDSGGEDEKRKGCETQKTALRSSLKTQNHVLIECWEAFNGGYTQTNQLAGSVLAMGSLSRSQERPSLAARLLRPPPLIVLTTGCDRDQGFKLASRVPALKVFACVITTSCSSSVVSVTKVFQTKTHLRLQKIR